MFYHLIGLLNSMQQEMIDLHNNGQWFARTCTSCENIGHCFISSDGHITRLTLFPDQDNFIRSLCMSSDNRWLLVS